MYKFNIITIHQADAHDTQIGTGTIMDSIN